jgi:hypothetical protein
LVLRLPCEERAAREAGEQQDERAERENERNPGKMAGLAPCPRPRRRGECGALLARSLRRVFQRVHHFADACIALVGVFGKRLAQDLFDRRTNFGIERSRSGRRLVDLRDDRGVRRVAGKGDAPGEHLVQHHAERVDVGADVHTFGFGLFGGNVLRRADEHFVRKRRFAALGEARQAKVGEINVPVAVNQNVRRFDVAVQHALRVGVRQRSGDRANDFEYLGRFEFPGAQNLLERFAVNVLERQEGCAIEFAEIVNGDDVRVIQFGDDGRLALQTRQEGFVFPERGVDHFERDIAIEGCMMRPKDRRHAALRDKGSNRVGSYGFTNCKAHARFPPLAGLYREMR